LIEVFSSLQGEGPWVGVRQIFLRFGGCNWACSYCDTATAAGAACRIEETPGSGRFRSTVNPVLLDFIAELVAGMQVAHPGAHHSISVTGGEPLLQEDVLLAWLPRLREILPIYLETNGTLPECLEKVLPWLDFVAMDIKLSSVTGTPTPWNAHQQFLRLATRVRCCVKVVVGDSTSPDELIRAATMVQSMAPETPLILQPLSRGGKIAPGTEKLLRMQELAAGIYGEVRVIPQNHLFLRLL
jgi:organic radical activating enzyme